MEGGVAKKMCNGAHEVPIQCWFRSMGLGVGDV